MWRAATARSGQRQPLPCGRGSPTRYTKPGTALKGGPDQIPDRLPGARGAGEPVGTEPGAGVDAERGVQRRAEVFQRYRVVLRVRRDAVAGAVHRTAADAGTREHGRVAPRPVVAAGHLGPAGGDLRRA